MVAEGRRDEQGYVRLILSMLPISMKDQPALRAQQKIPY
jgi:hypothetical protein